MKGHPSNCISDDGLAWHLDGSPLDKFVDEAIRRLQMRASKDGVFIQAMDAHMLGVDDAKAMAEALVRVANHARQRGAPSHLPEQP